MRSFVASTIAASLMFAVHATAPSAAAVVAPPPSRDARELLPPAWVGGWKIDLAASRYDPSATPPKNHFRFFDYTEDGKVLVTFMTLFPDGRQSVGHWSVQLDGTPGFEFARANGSTPYSVMSLKKIDDQTITMTVRRQGVITQESVFRLTPDGKTLTYTAPAGKTQNVVVYKRWDMAS